MGIFCRNENDTSLFLRKPSTYWVTLVRLIMITVPYILLHTNEKIGKCIYNSSLLSVLLRPHETLAHMEEAHAISRLSKSSDYFSSFYSTSDSIRIPPLMLFLLSPFQTSDAGLWLSILLLLVDFLISYLLEQIGIQFVSKSRIFSDTSNTSLNLRPLEEDDLQRKLPDEIRPQNEHIFPIYKSDLDSSSKSTEKQLSEENKTVRPLINMRNIPLISAQLYYWSPFTFLPTGLWHCFQNIPSLFLVASFYESLSGSLSMTSFYIAVAVYIEPHHIMYLVPIILAINVGNIGQSSTTTTTISAQKKQNIVSSSYAAAVVVVLFTLWSLCLQGISYHLLGSIHYWKALRSVYGTTWLTNGPNLSLQWYFRMQIFSRFRHYFGAMFALFPFVLVGPIYLRFIRYPEVQLAALSMLACIYRPVQVLFDANLSLCFLMLCPRSLARMGTPALIALCCLFVPVLLNVVDHWMWLESNNGNANYMFFQCLAYNTFLAIVLGQFISASVQRDKALRLIVQREMSGEKEKIK